MRPLRLRKWRLRAELRRAGTAATALSAHLYRHSRVSGNPAVACQDCGIIRQYLSGFPLTRE